MTYKPPHMGNRNIGATPTPNLISSSFSPTQVANIRAWYKADALNLADNASVTTWTDSSSAGNNATGGNAPIFKVGILNSYPVVRFDGINDFLVSGYTLESNAATIFFVGRFRSSVFGQRIFGLASTASIFDNTPTWGYYSNEAVGVVDLGGVSNNFSQLTIVYNSTSSASASVNQAAGATFDPGDGYVGMQAALSADSSTGLIVGFSDIAEVIIYNGAVGAADRTLIENYLRTKYNV